MSDLAYFQRRLAAAQKATQLPASARYDLAASTLDDDAFDQTIGEFGGPDPEGSGFGISEVLGEYLSRDPKYVSVSSISELQNYLVNTGYLPKGFEPTGTYDPVTSAAFRRQERDALDKVRSGSHFGSAPVKDFFQYLAYTVPTEVVKGAVGIAGGIVKDAATAASNPIEVLEEGGALGGAAVGALAGASIGALFFGAGAAPGALIGGAIGGVGGFFSDLFGEDDTPEEEDQDNWHKILDALTPVDEISAGQASNLFAALSTVMTASAVLKGASLAMKGTQTAVAGAQATAAATGRTTLQQAFTRGAKGTIEPGMIAKLGQSAIRHPVFGGAVTGGLADALPEFLEADFGQAAKDFVRGAGVGALTGGVLGKVAPTAVKDRAIQALGAAPIRRITETGAGKVAQALYTGASVSTIGGRLAGELPGTAQSESIERAQELDFGIGGHVIDWTVGLALYPERLLPWRARDMSRAMTTLASDNLLLPFAEAARKVRDTDTGQIVVTSLGKGMTRAREMMGAGRDGHYDPTILANRMTWSYVQKGLDDEVAEVMRTTPFETKLTGARADHAKLEKFGELRSHRIRQIQGEIAENGTSDLAKTYFEQGTANPHSMQLHVENFEEGGSLLDEFAGHHAATEFLQERSRMIAAGTAREGVVAEKSLTLTPAIRSDLPGGYQTRDDFVTMADEYEIAGNAYKEAFEKAKGEPGDSPLVIGRTEAAKRYDDALSNLRNRKMIDEGEYQKLRPIGAEPAFDPKIANELREVAKTRPFEIPEETQRLRDAVGSDRYIALSTGENILNYDHVPKLLDISGVAELSKKPGFAHALSSLGTRIDRADTGKMRFHSIVDELDNVAVRNNLDMDGRTMANRIYDSLKTRYDPEAALRAGQRLETGKVKVKITNERTGEIHKEWFKIDPRDLSTEDIHDALNLTGDYGLANEIKRGLHVGAAFGADTAHPIQTARALGRALRVHGMPAFSDYMRTVNFVPKRLRDTNKFLEQKGSYGYIGHNLRRAHMALQFSLSPTFDASRYVEAMTFGKMNDIPIKYALQPGKQIRKGTWKSPYSAAPVTGGEAYNNMIRLGDEIFHGRPVMQNFDEIQLRAMHSGMLGFKPRETEYAHAWVLAQRKMKNGKLTSENMEEIRETVLQIHQYGAKQTAFGNSMHFTFFPFLFSFKQLRQFHDFTLGAPMRNLMVHEGMRRWDTLVDDETLGTKFADAFKDHIPLAEELGRLNNLSYGIGPGRFFLEGIMDKDDEGKVAQALTEFFLPGGVHQPVASAVGESADALKQLFVPVILLDREGNPMATADKFGEIFRRLAPIYRDVDRWFFEETGGKVGPIQGVVGETISTLREGQNPMSQFQDLLDFKRVEGQALDEMAVAAGYSSWESLSQSEAGAPIAQQVREINLAVESNFPSGSRMANEFTNSSKQKDQNLYLIAQKPDKTKAEETIAAMGLIEAQAKLMAAELGISQEEMLRHIAPIVRGVAMGLTGDRQFMNLYNEMFATGYGPLRKLEVA